MKILQAGEEGKGILIEYDVIVIKIYAGRNEMNIRLILPGIVINILAAGEDTGERLWRLPMWAEYDKMVDSEVANVRNSAGREAGVITAGMFLKRFVGDTPWAHLDIAGNESSSSDRPLAPKGATGFGVRLLVNTLQSWS